MNKKKLLLLLLSIHLLPLQSQEYRLVWSDEFNTDGRPDSTSWNFEQGYARNEELQWYQPDNATVRGGYLIIEARPEHRPNPLFREGARDWRHARRHIECTSSSLTTSGKREFMYGRFEVRARIPVGKGAWPAIWTLGTTMEWPSNGEIDIMEYYRIKGEPHILANAAWGTDRRWDARWDSQAIPFTHFTQRFPDWASEFHIWRMDWDKDFIRLYLDNELMNEIPLDHTSNGKLGNYKNPFRQPHYLLLNLAIGGINGGPVSPEAYPMRYEIDYVRVYQKKESGE